jgi:hypothetical protein
MNEMQKCRMIQLPVLGENATGYISVTEAEKNIPFSIKRVYWIYKTPADIIRGLHAHKELMQFIIGISGEIKLKCEYIDGSEEHFVLNSPSVGLFVPQMVWRNIIFSQEAVLLCMASHLYDENDYIRDYNEFKKTAASLK